MLFARLVSLTHGFFFDTVWRFSTRHLEIAMQKNIILPASDVEGVGLVLYDDEGRIFIAFEGRSKPQYDKEIGDPTVPWETRERLSDGTYETFATALNRTLDEEVGFEVQISELDQLIRFRTSFGVWTTIFLAKFDDAVRMGGTAIETGELLGWEWMFPRKLENRRVRGGMREILAAYQRYVEAQHRVRIIRV